MSLTKHLRKLPTEPNSQLCRLHISKELPKRLSFVREQALKWTSKVLSHYFSGYSRGFSLSELLISLMFLGVIATFTIPKIIAAQQNAHNAAVYKESMAALNAVVYYGMKFDGMTDSNVGNYILSHMNAVKICNSNASTQGCWDTATQGTPSWNNSLQPGMVLHNGAVIVGLDNCCGNGFGGQTPGEATQDLEIDVNGTAGPNQEGQDQFFFHVCFGTAPCTTYLSLNSSMIEIPEAAQQAFFQ